MEGGSSFQQKIEIKKNNKIKHSIRLDYYLTQKKATLLSSETFVDFSSQKTSILFYLGRLYCSLSILLHFMLWFCTYMSSCVGHTEKWLFFSGLYKWKSLHPSAPCIPLLNALSAFILQSTGSDLLNCAFSCSSVYHRPAAFLICDWSKKLKTKI
jgi:hypothetical protein